MLGVTIPTRVECKCRTLLFGVVAAQGVACFMRQDWKQEMVNCWDEGERWSSAGAKKRQADDSADAPAATQASSFGNKSSKPL